jgi:hypothetical protein
MPNLCGSRIEESGGKMSKEEEMGLLWAASNSMNGGLDTVSYFIFHFQSPETYKKMMIQEHIFDYDVLDDHDLESKYSKKGASRTRRCRRE